MPNTAHRSPFKYKYLFLYTGRMRMINNKTYVKGNFWTTKFCKKKTKRCFSLFNRTFIEIINNKQFS
jgi:hypothetical protein